MLKSLINLAAVASLFATAPALAQIRQIDPNQAYEGQSAPPVEAPVPADDYPPVEAAPYDPPPADQATSSGEYMPAPGPADQPAPSLDGFDARSVPLNGDTVPREDLINAAEGVFGRGAQDIARLIENILRDQGEPVAYIAGQEAGGAFVFGVRYGSGIMHHRIEGQRTVYWTGPSLGFDVGADANKVFVLVYNLHDSQDLFRRFPGAEGNAYFVGGFTAQYLRRGDIVLIPIRLGVGVRLGVNAGYMRFSERNRWVPF